MSFVTNTFRTTHDFRIKNFFAAVYGYLGLNILFAGAISYFVSENIEKFLFLYPQGLMTLIVYMVLLGFILHTLQNMLTTNDSSWFVILPILGLFLSIEGLFFAPFIVIYSSKSVLFAASLAASLLLAMCCFGLYTSVDLSKYHNIFILGVFATLIAEYLSLFVFKFAINLQLTSIGIIFAFLFFIANDMQMLRSLYHRDNFTSTTKLALLGSILMFMNFIVLLQRLLIIFGKKNDKR